MSQEPARRRQPTLRVEGRWWRPALAYAVVCAALWSVPVFGLLHAESAAVIAGAAFFVAGWASVGAFHQLEPLGAVLKRQLILLLVPWALLTVSMLWRPNCAYVTGLGIALVLVPPSAVLGVGLAYALTGIRMRGIRGWLVGIGLAVAVGGVAADLGFHPQLFTYNHVFGGVLGPIYDEELAVRPGLFAFRALTLLWASGLILGGQAVRSGPSQRRKMLAASVGVWGLIGATYVFAVPLGIQQSHAALEHALGARADVGPYEIVYDADETDADALRWLEDELLYRYHQLEAQLGVVPSDPIRVYVYPDAETKGALIGSRETSVVPVWLPRPQIHLLAERVERSVGHELVHVFAREFGVPVLRASPAVGLVEGLAVALEPPDGLPTPTDLVLAAQQRDIGAEGLERDPAAVVRKTMSPLGFWTARAGVAYTASGAFVRWLLDAYGNEPFRTAYRSGDVAGAYQRSLKELSEAWAASVDGQRASPQAVELAEDLLTRRSLFETVCPHHVPGFVRDARAGAKALEAGELGRARSAFASAWKREPRFEAAFVGWSAALLAGGEVPSVDSLRQIEAASVDSLTGPEGLVALADLNRVAGSDANANRLYAEALERTPRYAPLARALTQHRATLSREALLALASHPEDPARAAAMTGELAPIQTALLWDQAGASGSAWDVAQGWEIDSLGMSPLGRAALMSLQARLAYRVGAWSRAESLARSAAVAYRREGHAGPAALADDWASRARWRRSGSPLTSHLSR